MKRRKYLVQQTEAPIEILETSIKDVQKIQEDVDTITLKFLFQNGRCFSKRFCKYSISYLNNWKKKASGDNVSLKIKAGIIVDIY